MSAFNKNYAMEWSKRQFLGDNCMFVSMNVVQRSGKYITQIKGPFH